MSKNITTEYGNKLIDELLSVNFYDLTDTKDDRLTASEFNDPLKIMVLKRKLKKDIALLPANPDENLESLFGSAIHEILDRQDKDKPQIETEQRLHTWIDDVMVSGKFDRVDLENNILLDYKSTGLWVHLFDLNGEKHIEQLSIYRYLYYVNHKHLLDKALVIRFIRDYKGMLKMTGSYCKKHNLTPPDRGVVAVPVELMSIKKTLGYMQDKIKDFKRLMSMSVMEVQDNIQCDDEDMWRKVTGVRVIKETRQRCEKYCKVAPFCKQYQDWLKSNEN